MRRVSGFAVNSHCVDEFTLTFLSCSACKLAVAKKKVPRGFSGSLIEEAQSMIQYDHQLVSNCAFILDFIQWTQVVVFCCCCKHTVVFSSLSIRDKSMETGQINLQSNLQRTRTPRSSTNDYIFFNSYMFSPVIQIYQHH